MLHPKNPKPSTLNPILGITKGDTLGFDYGTYRGPSERQVRCASGHLACSLTGVGFRAWGLGLRV